MSIAFGPGQVCRWEPGLGFELDGRPCYVVGTNYVARYVCTNFWEDWRPEAIAEDLDRIAAAGLNAVRIPVHWEYAEPVPGSFRPEMLERMDTFFEMAAERGLLVMPWFLVGVATQNYDVSWRNGGSYFAEPMVSHAENHVRTMVGHLRRHPNILCWDLCDEPEGYSWIPNGETLPYDTDQFHHWLDRLHRAAKETDPERAVMLGFGPFGMGDMGMDVRRAAGVLDVMGVTAYPPYRKEDFQHGFRNTYFLGWSLRLSDCAGKGVFSCEAPGWSDVNASERSIGLFYRVTLSSQFANGSMGVLPWVWNDFDEGIRHLPPMDVSTAEPRFGISRADGSLKPAGEELRRFSELVAAYPPTEWPSVTPEVGVLMPMRPERVHHGLSCLFHHYVLLRQAGLRVRDLWIDDLPLFDGKLLFVPETPMTALRTGHWQQLERWVRDGGVLVSSNRQRTYVFNDLFGVVSEGERRCLQPLTIRACSSEVAGCEGLVLPDGRQYAEVSLAGGSALCLDQDGLPVVTMSRHGLGMAVYLAYPPEDALGALPAEELAIHGMHTLYRGLARLAGLSAPLTCPDPRVELDVRQHADGRLLGVAVNHSRFPVETTLSQEHSGEKVALRLAGSDAQWVVVDGPPDAPSVSPQD